MVPAPNPRNPSTPRGLRIAIQTVQRAITLESRDGISCANNVRVKKALKEIQRTGFRLWSIESLYEALLHYARQWRAGHYPSMSVAELLRWQEARNNLRIVPRSTLYEYCRSLRAVLFPNPAAPPTQRILTLRNNRQVVVRPRFTDGHIVRAIQSIMPAGTDTNALPPAYEYGENGTRQLPRWT